MPTICQITVIALLAAFVVLFLGKTGLRWTIRNYCDDTKMSIIADMLDCDFCLSFWTCFVISIIFWLFTGHINILLPFCSTPITRYLI